jgi:ribonuclease HI
MNYSQLTIHTDGGARGNPGPAAVGVVIENGKDLVTSFGKKIGETTNNVAEYEAVKVALEYLKKAGSRGGELHFYLDSQLVVQQLSGIYKIKKAHLKNLFDAIKLLEKEVGESVTYTHIPREENSEADRLVNQALDAS